MRNLLISLLICAVIVAILSLTGILNTYEAIVPGIIALIASYFVLMRRTLKRVEAIFSQASKSLSSSPPKLDLAISTIEKAYTFCVWQFGVRSQVDTQIGVIYFLQQDFKKSLPYLERSLGFGYWLGGAMLGVIYYKKKDHASMRKTFDIIIKRAKKQSLAWNLYAYLLTQINDRPAAQALLAIGVKKTKNDPKVAEALLAVQNNKKINMRSYKEQWYQFHLERPPPQQAFIPGGRVSRIERRGRW
ncbi:MAG: hypothetical protein JW841_10855 [Deltaproteobacteria bacterium]|nr:hypothetical protein [Deltaproteobacteria bacterium]